MADAPRQKDALMFKTSRDNPPDFLSVAEPMVSFYRWLGWHLLIKESDVRFADLDDVRREDEKGRR
jgi:hypothetical protein